MLHEIAIDERTWGDADEARRHEWTSAIRDMLAHAELLSFPADADKLVVTVSEQASTLDLLAANGTTLASAIVSRSAISAHVTEYVDIVRQIDKADHGMGSARLEALDMGKKLAHDDAARTLQKLCAPLGADHETCRRLWTLLLVLRVDTTRLTGVRGHRPVR
jgi:uncharacterized protein (UPF0262 family)